MRLLPIDPRQVVIRSLAVAPCYTIVRGALSTNQTRRAEVPNHCGFGVVEAVGAMVKRVQVGDRVVVAGTSQCGQCYQCLQGRPDYCQFTFFSNAPGVEPFAPFAQFRDSALQPPKVVPARLRQSTQLSAGGVAARYCWMKLA